jgi:hypothetical protein
MRNPNSIFISPRLQTRSVVDELYLPMFRLMIGREER